MAAKRLLDAVSILTVAHGVAKKSLELRSKQLELCSKTSSLAKAFRSQSERVTQPIKATSLLTTRLNEPSISELSEAASEATIKSSKNLGSILRPKVFKSDSKLSFTEKKSSKLGPPLKEQSTQYSVNEQKRVGVNPHLGEPKSYWALGENQDADRIIIKENRRSSNVDINLLNDDKDQQRQSTQAILEEPLLPEDVNTNLFHSPRVARLLGGKTQGQLPAVPGANAVKSIANDQSKANKSNEADNCHTSRPLDLSSKILNRPNLELAQRLTDDVPLATDSKISKTGTDPNLNSSRLRESRVPASRIARLWNYGGLAAGMLGGMVSEGFRRAGGADGGSYLLNANNMNRLVTKLSRMRGAALKLGQMISFQDSKIFPTPVQEVLQRVQDSADYMPSYQRDKVLVDNLGSDWRNKFSSFDEIPIAAASIGQVHRAVLKSNGAQVAVKVQYPGVAESIDSDLKNLEILLTASRLLPKGLYLDKTIANARTELAWECDYIREAECARCFQQYLRDETKVFVVPNIYSEASGRQVLTMELMYGVAITKIKNLSQEEKDWIGTQILRLCLREIIEFRFMQTDPNWTNFLYNKDSRKIELLDFGASREYSQEFIGKYTQLLVAASRLDRESLEKLSIDLGYLTGYEAKTMLDAHIDSILTLAEPFSETSPYLYDFRNQTITDRVRELIPLMIRERLSPPPEETYSLHRKLSGAFLLCARLGSRVPCRKLFEESCGKISLI